MLPIRQIFQTHLLEASHSSLVLRCDDCITYHVIAAKERGVSDKEFDEVMSIGLVVGGSITIPHIRRATDLWEELG